MLCLTRKVGEEILIGDNVVLTIVEIRRGVVRIGITAPREVNVVRGEIARGDHTSKAK